MSSIMRHRGRYCGLVSVYWTLSFLGQQNVRAQVPQVHPTLGGDPVLIEPTSVPGYRDCIKNVSSSHCVGGSSIRAQAPFDPSTACPTTPLYDITGQLVSDDLIASQLGACINAVRENPDAFACLYQCDYPSWRNDVITPSRGGLTTTGSTGATELQESAQQHSSDMAADNYFSHTGSDGSGLEDRAADNGFYTFPLGENIAAGFVSIQSVVIAWMCSSGHRTNLMGCGFDTVGSAAAYNNASDFLLYFTQDFGCSRDDFNCQCPQIVNASSNAPAVPAADLACIASPAAAPAPLTAAPAIAPSLAAAAAPVPAAASPEAAAAPAPIPTPGAAPGSGPSSAASPTSIPAAAPAPAVPASGPGLPLPEPGYAAVPTAISTGVGEGTYQSYITKGGAPVPAYSGRALAPTAISAAEVGYVTQSGPGLAPSAISYQEVTGPGYVASGAAVAPAAASSAYAQGPSASSLGSNTAPGLYATGMELPASSGALAATNSDTAVLVLVLPAAAPVSVADVSAVLQGGATGSVMDVQPFPGQSSSYLIEVEHPSGFTGNAVVIIASQPEIAPLTYQVVDRSLTVQSLGFNLLSERS